MQQRVLIDTPTTLSEVFEVDGAPTDPAPATATVTITRGDGTVLVSNQSATRTDVGTFAISLSAVQNNQVDTLTARWISTLGTLTTRVEIVGGFLFTIAQARGRAPLDDEAAYPLADIVDARTRAEQELEDACGVALVPRYAIDTITCRRQRALRLAHRRVRVIRTVSVDGVALSPSAVAALTIDAGQLLCIGRYSRWGIGRVVVGYEHGLDAPPPAADTAALDLARDRLISDTGSATIDPRATRIITDDGEIRLGDGGHFGIPSVDRFVDVHREALVA